MQEFTSRIRCDDGTVTPDYPLHGFYDQMRTIFADHYGFDLHAIEKAPTLLRELGFVNIQQNIFDIPIGEWSKDTHLRTIGAYFREALTEMFSAMAAKPFADHGVDRSDTSDLLQAIKPALLDKRIHAYMPVHIVWAQKPYT